MLKVAMLGKWHVHAEGYANELKKSGKVEIKAVWDDDVERGKKWAEQLRCDFEPCLNTLLTRDDIEAVIVCNATTKHHDVMIAAAKAGKHIFTEKALAPTVAECLEIKKAIEEAGVTFTISYPQRGRGITKLARKLIDEGYLGRVTFIRMRDAHNGVSGNWLPKYWFEEKDAAGGAMMDLGCHPMYILALLGGKPIRVTGLFNAPLGSKIDENAVAIAEFENGILGVAETGFDSAGSPQTLEVYGTEGCIIAHGEGNIIFNSNKPHDADFIKNNMPEGNLSPILQFVDACINGTGSPDMLGIDDAIALTQLLELSYKGDRENKICVVE